VPPLQVSKFQQRTGQFISVRTAASILSLLYSLAYTAYLGPEKRSVLTFVLTASMVLTVVSTTGLSLYIRSRPPAEINPPLIYSYLLLSIGAASLVSIFSTIILIVYSSNKTSLPIVLIFLCFLYSFLSTFTLSLIDCFIAIGKLKFSMVFDLLLVLMQILVGVIFVVLNQTSEIVAIIISFLASYSIISFSILSLLVFLFPYKNIRFGREVKNLITKSKHLYVVGIANGVVDRIDKLAIGLFLPLEVLGKYALASGVLAFGRFLPEAMAKTVFFDRKEIRSSLKDANLSTRGIVIFVGSMIFSICAVEIIVLSFGEEWGLPFTFSLAFSVQELLRAYYQISISNLLLLGRDDIVAISARYLLVLSLITIPLLTFYLGIYGPLAALGSIYFVMITYIRYTNNKGGNN